MGTRLVPPAGIQQRQSMASRPGIDPITGADDVMPSPPMIIDSHFIINRLIESPLI